MIAASIKIKHLTMSLAVVAAMLIGTTQAQANPVKLVPSSQIGSEVNKTTKGKICTVASKDECQPGKTSGEAGGFFFPGGVATTVGGDVYVADEVNGRVQEFTAAGDFVLAFGREVDATTKANICTATSGDVCKAGVEGSAAGQLDVPQNVVVDPVSGNVYVAEYVFGTGGMFGLRVQEFTAGGKFILEIGKEVNKTTKGNLCTQVEVEKASVNCGGPAQAVLGTSEHSAFDFGRGKGNLLSDGGEHDLLYVGEENRIQEFEADGEWKGEIPLSGQVGAMALDTKTSDLYVVYGFESTVHQLGPDGKEILHFEIAPREEGQTVILVAIAIDPSGNVATAGFEDNKELGSLYNPVTGLPLPGFTIPEGADVVSLAFSETGELDASANSHQEVLSYIPEPAAEVITGAVTCKEGMERETSVTFDCTLNGEINPFNVEKTETWFEWGRREKITCARNSDTAKEEVETAEALLAVAALIEGLRPDENFCDRIAANDQNVQQPEQLIGRTESFSTPILRAKIVGSPVASFVKSSSAVMFGELNPENASTEYFFEYAPELQPGEKALAECPGIKQTECPGVAATQTGESGLYGKMGVTIEDSDLQPGTTYQYRLAAVNGGGESHGTGAQEATFVTPPAPSVQAQTGSFAGVTSTSASITGSVNPDGQPATYTFELGVYQGAATRFGTVVSGPTGTVTETKSLLLTGLQPGTEYAYRIKIASGFGTATGGIVTFKTEGLPAILATPVPPPLLAVPNIALPKPPQKCKPGYALDGQRKCVKAKVKKKTKKRQRRASKKARKK